MAYIVYRFNHILIILKMKSVFKYQVEYIVVYCKNVFRTDNLELLLQFSHKNN